MTKNTKIFSGIAFILMGAVILLSILAYNSHTSLKAQEELNVELREKSANDSILIKDLKGEKDTLESQRQERADMAEKRFELMQQKDKQLEEKDAQIEQLNKDLQAKRERQEAERKAAEVQKQKQVAQAKTTAPSQSGGAVSSSKQVASAAPVTVSRGEGEPSGGREFYVEATAYGPDCVGCSGITATGINVGANPNMKLIAVDPNVIPLGSKVWVEGYGYAIAGDTGGDIKGNRIDVLYPSEAAAYSWGRRTVKIRVLN